MEEEKRVSGCHLYVAMHTQSVSREAGGKVVLRKGKSTAQKMIM